MLWFIMKEMYYFSVHPELVEGYLNGSRYPSTGSGRTVRKLFHF
jgi:hypothetical protein